MTVFTSFAGALALSLAIALAASNAAARDDESGNRYERRAAEMALPDPVLDSFGEHEPERMPGLFDARIPDSVEHVALDEERLDPAEQEEYERYMIEHGLMPDPHDDLGRDRWDGGASPPETAGPDAFDDPVEW